MVMSIFAARCSTDALACATTSPARDTVTSAVRGQTVVVSASTAEPLWRTNLVLGPPIREVGASEIFGIPGLFARNSTHIQLSFNGYENPTLVEGALGVVGPLDLDGDGIASEFVMYSAETVFSVAVSEVVECPLI